MPFPLHPVSSGTRAASFCSRVVGRGVAAVFAATLAWWSGEAAAAPFTAGDVVVYRTGSGSGSLQGSGSPVFLDEYTPGGVLVQSIAMPTSPNGLNRALVASGPATSEGFLTRSANGRFLALTGYAAVIPTSGLSSTLSTTVPRVVGLVDEAGFFDTSTALTDFSSGNNPRTAATTNGHDLWAGGGSGGVHYTTLGATTSISVSTTVTNIRELGVYFGQLYLSTASGAAGRVGTVGMGLPMTSGQTIANLPGIPTAGAADTFFLADLDAAVPGSDTLYIADEVAGVQKFCLVGGSWTAEGVAGSGADVYRGLTGFVNGTNVILYATRKGGSTGAGGGELVSFVDATGYQAPITAEPTLLARAAPLTAMRGVALAPVLAPDLTISASGPAVAAVGANFSYTLSVANGGGTAATDVEVQFTLPPGVAYAGAAGPGFAVTQAAGVVTFSGGSVGADGTELLTVTVSPQAPGTFTLPGWAAVVDPANAILEVDEGNNASLNPVTTLASLTPDLTVSCTAPAQAVKDTPFPYTITASNAGLADATGVSLQFTLPAGLIFQSGSGAGFSVGEAGGVVTFSGGSIAASSFVSLTVNAVASPATPTTFRAEAGAAIIDPSHTVAEANEANNTSPDAASTLVRLFPLPVATADSYTTAANVPLSVGAGSGLMANDSSSTLGLVMATSTAHGTVSVQADGSFAYTPAPGYVGDDTFSYTVTDAAHGYKTNLPPLGIFGGVAVTAGGYGSGLSPVPGAPGEYYGVTDRGPNVDGVVTNSKVLPVPGFSPAIGRFKLVNGQAVLQGAPLTLKAADGTPYTGNGLGDLFYALDGTVLQGAPNGYDSEALVAVEDGTFWVSDEYGPFLTHFDATGRQTFRVSPADGTLPVELAHRLSNRGMEGLALTPDGKMLVGMMQSALDQPDLGGADCTKIAPLRIVTYTLATGALHEYLYLLQDPNTNNKVSVSELTAVSNTTFLVDERDNQFPPTASKKLYLIDLAGATDIGPGGVVAGASYEAAGQRRGLLVGGQSIEAFVGLASTAAAADDLAGVGITPVGKSLYFDLGALLFSLDPQGRFFSHDKVEGVAVADGGNTLVFANDSDFGIDGLTNNQPPFQLHAKSSPATPGVPEDGEFLVVDRTRLPAATSMATVTIHVIAVPDPVVYDGPTNVAPVLDDGQVVPVDFGDVPVFGSVARTFTVQNSGSADLTGLAVTFGGVNAGDFNLGAEPAANLAPGATTTFTVVFTPQAGHTRSGSLLLASNAPGAKASYDFPLSGRGVLAAGTNDAINATVGVTRIYPLANDRGLPANTTIISATGLGVIITDDGRALLIPAGFTGPITYETSQGTTATVEVTAGVPATAPRRFTGLLRDATGADAGWVTMNISAMGSASAQVLVSSGRGRARFGFARTASMASTTTALGALNFVRNADGTMGATLVVTSGNLIATMRPVPAASPVEKYHVALASVDAGIPGGGYLSLMVRRTSDVAIVGTLPDGRPFNAATSISDNGTIAFYAVESRFVLPSGGLGGELTSGDLAATDLTGELAWTKPAQSIGAKGEHLSGVHTLLTANGCLYTGGPLLAGAGTLNLTGGNLAADEHSSVTIAAGAPSLPAGALTAWAGGQAAAGKFRARVKVPGVFRPVSAGGLYLPKSHSAWGYFPGTTVGGRIELTAP